MTCRFGAYIAFGAFLASAACGDDPVPVDVGSVSCPDAGACAPPACTGAACESSTAPAVCEPGHVRCGSACVDPLTSATHCGAQNDCEGTAAGVACASGEVCAQGTCAVSCPAGFVECDARCIDPKVDLHYCGAHADCVGGNQGSVCATGEVCAAGACSFTCPAGFVICAGRCVEPAVDRNYCGASAGCTGSTAGTACASGEVCAQGTCAVSCPVGFVQCDERCVDPELDRNHCGAQGDCTGAAGGAICATGEVCAAGACSLTCPAGFVSCLDRCVDPAVDRNHCGASADCTGPHAGTACDAGEVCAQGSCAVSCPAGFVECGGRCIDPELDRNHCGAQGDCTGADQGSVCTFGEVCAHGTCGIECASGSIVCAGRCVDPATDSAHCGAANDCTGSARGAVCSSGEACVGGLCRLTCSGQLINCDEECVDAATDVRYCGAANACTGSERGSACAGDEVCSGGVCQCAAGLVGCGGHCIDPASNNDFCGATGACDGSFAGTVCDPATEACQAGACVAKTVVPFTTASPQSITTSVAVVEVQTSNVSASDPLTVSDSLLAMVTVSGPDGLTLTATSAALRRVDASGITAGDFTWTAGALSGTATISGSASGTNNVNFTLASAAVSYIGGSGNDVVTGSNNQANIVDLGAGTNSFTGGNGNYTITAGDGDDSVAIGRGNSTVSLGNGNNHFNAISGNNTYVGGSGADAVVVGGGSNDLRVGTGADSITLTATNPSIAVYTIIRDPHAGLVITFPDQGIETFRSSPVTVTDPSTATLSDFVNTAVALSGNGASNGQFSWFQFAGNTFVVEVRHDGSSQPSFSNGNDLLLKLQGLVDLRTATLLGSNNTLTLN